MTSLVEIKRILIEKGAEKHAMNRRILEKFNNTHVKIIEQVNPEDNDWSAGMDKNSLRLIDFQGEFLKPCPGTNEYICCGYQILHTGTNCPLDCSYCILQAYFNQPSLRIFVNLEKKLAQVGKTLDSQPEKIFRIGTGEFADSLALDNITDASNIITNFFKGRKNAVLELKTKTDEIGGLLRFPQRDRIIVSWSLNSSYIASKEEHRAPSIKKRLKAARKCQEEGYLLGFHFDPLIRHFNWQEGYSRTIDMMNKYIDPKKVIWISMGCIRYIPSLKPVIRKRHPNTHVLDGEFIKGMDGKKRYFKPIRIETYRYINNLILEWKGDKDGVYLCMESDEVWKKSLGWSPETSDGLSEYLDNRVRVMFNSPLVENCLL